MIEIAASLRFGIGASGNAWLRRGWSDPEEGFVWALGARSSLTLSLLPAPGRVFLELTLKPFVNPPRLTRRRLDIVVNGKLLAEKTLSEQATVRIEIPAEIRRQPGLLVEFRHPEAQTPAQLGLGDDQRALAIQLHAVTILLTGSRDELVKPAGPSSVLAAYRFGGNETTDAMLLEGWGEPEVDYVWSVGRRSILRLPISREKQAHTLVLDMLPFTQRDAVPRQRIAVGADDQLLGFISMHQRSAFAFALPPPKGRANAVVLSFDNLDGTPRETGLYKDGRPFVFMLLRLRVLRHPRPMERAESPLRNISLPGNLYDGSLQRSVLAATGFAANEVANVFESLGSKLRNEPVAAAART